MYILTIFFFVSLLYHTRWEHLEHHLLILDCSSFLMHLRGVRILAGYYGCMCMNSILFYYLLGPLVIRREMCWRVNIWRVIDSRLDVS